MKVNATKLAEIHGIDRRTVTNWVNSTPPCPSRMEGRSRVFETADVAKWLVERAVAAVKAEAEVEETQTGTIGFEQAKARKMVAEAEMAELNLQKAKREVIPTTVHEERVADLCEALAGPVKGIGKYLGDVQAAQSDLEAAALLERIKDELLRALQATADDINDEPGAPGDAAA